MAWWKRNRLRLLFVVLLLVAAALMHASLQDPMRRGWFSRTVLWLAAPLQKAFTWSIEGVASLWHDYFYLVGVREENERLQLELERLQQLLARQGELEAENAELRRLLKMREQLHLKEAIAARVVARSSSSLVQLVRIDAGRRQGVGEGDAVAAGGGLVGRVIAAGPAYSDVRLVVDGASSVAVVDQRSRVPAIVRGQGVFDECLVDYLKRTADVQVGDLMVTSGAGGEFAPGLPVGVVERISSPRTGLYRQAWLKPAADFERLERVMVIRSARRLPEDEAK